MADAPKDRDVIATAAQVDNPSYQDNLKVRRDPDGSVWIVDASGNKVMSGVPANQKALGATTSSSGVVAIQLPDKPVTPIMAAIWGAFGQGRQRLLVFGCSIAQQCNAYLAATTSTVSGGDIKAGVNQITVANGALYTVGDGVGIPLYNARIWITTITGITGNVLTIADKLPGLVRNGSAVTRFTSGLVPSLNMGYGAINAAVALLGGPVEVVPSYGYGGAIFTQMYCDLERDLRYYRPHYVALHMYENDMTSPPTSGASLDQFKGWARLMAKMCLAYGAIPIVCSSMPYYNCVTGGGVPYSRNADFDGLLDYLCKPVADGKSQLQIDVPGSYGMDLSTPWLDPDFVSDTTFARRPIYAKLSGGALSAAEQTLSNWTAITAGSFQITLDGVVRTVSGLNFSSATSLTQVASIIKTGIGVYGLCNWDATAGRFILRCPATISYASATGSGTDISALLKVTSAAAASIGQGWTDGVHPLTNKRFAEGYFAKPLLQQILPPAQSLLDYVVTPRETSGMVGTTGPVSGLQAGSVVAKNHTGVAWVPGTTICTFSKNSDGSQKIAASWPGAASRSADYITDRFSYTFPTVWAGSTQRFRVYARMKINAMSGIAQILPSATILETGTAREVHAASTGLDMCDSLLADGSIIMLETPVFALGPLATSINLTVDIRPKDASSPSGALIDIDIIEMGLLPVMPETPHGYV